MRHQSNQLVRCMYTVMMHMYIPPKNSLFSFTHLQILACVNVNSLYISTCTCTYINFCTCSSLPRTETIMWQLHVEYNSKFLHGGQRWSWMRCPGWLVWSKCRWERTAPWWHCGSCWLAGGSPTDRLAQGLNRNRKKKIRYWYMYFRIWRTFLALRF